MLLRNVPIRRKLTMIILVTCALVMLMMRVSFFLFDYLKFRQANVRQLSILGQVIADNSTAPLAFDNPEDADEILGSLRAEPYVIAAALYNQDGELFSRYPPDLPDRALPAELKPDGNHFIDGNLAGFQPVVQVDKRLGTLYLELDTRTMVHQWLLASGAIGLTVMAAVFLLAYAVSVALQKQISEPILSLAKTAREISQHRDYSVRATKRGDDELGLLTDAFNQMLAEIQGQNAALRESEARVRAIINSALSAVVVIDSEGKVTVWNARAENLFGWPRREAIGRKVEDLIFPRDPKAPSAKGIVKLMATGEAAVRGRIVEMTGMRRDGSEFPIELSISPLQAGGEVTFCAFITDITRRKRAEERIRQLNASLEQRVVERTSQLEAVNKELEAFCYSVSHDLRAPLRHITGFADLLRHDCQSVLGESQRRHLKVISNSALQMGELIDGLLTFSRMGRSELRRTNVKMNDLAAEVVDGMATDLAGRNVSWEINALPEVQCDRVMLKQVWVNLLSNAVKYTRDRDPAVIRIDCRENGRDWEFSVADNGAGFDMKYADKLFGVFQRLHTVDEFEGTGIGLANVQRIVLRHGGRVWAEGKPDSGACFHFTLPKIGDIHT